MTQPQSSLSAALGKERYRGMPVAWMVVLALWASLRTAPNPERQTP